MSEEIKKYGFWRKGDKGGWMMDTMGRFISSSSKGELAAYQRQMQSIWGTENYDLAAFGDDGYPVFEDSPVE